MIRQDGGEAEGTQEVVSFTLNSGVSESSSEVPFYEYEKLWRVSSRTFESEPEFLTKNHQRIKSQRQAHVFLKVPGNPGRLLALPRVRTPLISARARAAGLEKVFDQPHYTRLGTGQIPERAHEHAVPPNMLPASNSDQIVVREPDTTNPARVEIRVSDAEENFAGPEIILKPRKTKKKKKR